MKKFRRRSFCLLAKNVRRVFWNLYILTYVALLTPVGLYGSNYFVTFIDDWSTFTIVYLMGSKSEVFNCFGRIASVRNDQIRETNVQIVM